MSDEMTRHRRALGADGEDIAADYLRALDWLVLERNWRSAGGEIDIIAYDPGDDSVVGVEVKTRNTAYFGRPVEAVKQAKVDRLHRLIRTWVSDNGAYAREIRIDLIGLVVDGGGLVDLEHLRDIA